MLVTFQEDDAVKLLTDMELVFKGEKLRMRRAKMPVRKKNNQVYIRGVRKLFIGALPSKLTLVEFRAYFEQFGELADICLPWQDKKKRLNRGHGFVTYKDTKSAKRVIEQKHPHSIREKFVS